MNRKERKRAAQLLRALADIDEATSRTLTGTMARLKKQVAKEARRLADKIEEKTQEN